MTLVEAVTQWIESLRRIEDRLMPRFPEIWITRPLSLIGVLGILIALVLFAPLGLSANHQIMRALDDTELAQMNDAYWLRVCVDNAEEIEFYRCIDQEYPNGLPASIEAIISIGSQNDLSISQLIEVYRSKLSVSMTAFGFGILVLLCCWFFLIFGMQGNSIYMYRRKRGIPLFLIYFTSLAITLIPVLIYWYLLLPYPNIAQELFLKYSVLPLIFNFAIFGGLTALFVRNFYKGIEIADPDDWSLTARAGSGLLHFVLGAIMLIAVSVLRIDSDTAVNLAYFRWISWVYISAYVGLVVVAALFYGLFSRRRRMFFDLTIVLMYGAISAAIAFGPMRLVSQYSDAEIQYLGLLSFSMLGVSILLAVLLSFVAQYYWNRTIAVPE